MHSVPFLLNAAPEVVMEMESFSNIQSFEMRCVFESVMFGNTKDWSACPAWLKWVRF